MYHTGNMAILRPADIESMEFCQHLFVWMYIWYFCIFTAKYTSITGIFTKYTITRIFTKYTITRIFTKYTYIIGIFIR